LAVLFKPTVIENIPQIAAQFGIENLPIHFISHDFFQILLLSPSTEDRVAPTSISDTLKLELAILTIQVTVLPFFNNIAIIPIALPLRVPLLMGGERS
jgi:hypothetical protein